MILGDFILQSLKESGVTAAYWTEHFSDADRTRKTIRKRFSRTENYSRERAKSCFSQSIFCASEMPFKIVFLRPQSLS